MSIIVIPTINYLVRWEVAKTRPPRRKRTVFPSVPMQGSPSGRMFAGSPGDSTLKRPPTKKGRTLLRPNWNDRDVNGGDGQSGRKRWLRV